MARDTSLDALIRSARGAEDASPAARVSVRSQLEQRLLANTPADRALEASVLAPEPSPLGRALLWGIPFVTLGLIALTFSLRTAPSPTPIAAAPALPPFTNSAAAANPVATTPAPETPAALPPAAPAPPAAKPPPLPRPPAPAASAASAPAAAAASAPAAAAAAAPASAPLPPSLLAESQALASVQRALRDGESSRALALLTEQDQTFANGALGEERAAARVVALCSSGAGSAASAAVAFIERYPGSVLAARVHAACSSARSVKAP